MLTLKQIKTLGEEIMNDEFILNAAAPAVLSEDVDERTYAAYVFGNSVIALTLSKLSELISDIPSAEQMDEMFLADMMAGIENMLDTNN